MLRIYVEDAVADDHDVVATDRNLDAILTQAKPQDLDILIRDHHYEARMLGQASSMTNDAPAYGRTVSNMISQITPLRSRSYSVDLSDNESSTINQNQSAARSKADCNADNNTMSRTKDLDSSSSVARLIKAVKKKLASIDGILSLKYRSVPSLSISILLMVMIIYC
jgi:hypothetical protein